MLISIYYSLYSTLSCLCTSLGEDHEDPTYYTLAIPSQFNCGIRSFEGQKVICHFFYTSDQYYGTIYQHSDDVNGDNVDVRTLVMGLKGNSDYTAQVIPDHNPPTTISTKTDYEGIFWVVAKVLNGESSLLFKVNVYEGNGTEGHLVASGDDDAPCYRILPFKD